MNRTPVLLHANNYCLERTSNNLEHDASDGHIYKMHTSKNNPLNSH